MRVTEQLPRGRAPPASPSVAEPPAVPLGATEHCLESVCARCLPGRGRVSSGSSAAGWQLRARLRPLRLR